MPIPYWLCGVNFKMRQPTRRMRKSLYHTDSVESTSKSSRGVSGGCRCYTILTLWSQLQNKKKTGLCVTANIPYWLCGVNFKIDGRDRGPAQDLYHTDSVESTSKSSSGSTLLSSSIPYWLCGVNFKMNTLAQVSNDFLYHTDSVESTSKLRRRLRGRMGCIPYWLCGVNFKMRYAERYDRKSIYHTDSVESTSKCERGEDSPPRVYTILTLWSQLQNVLLRPHASAFLIPYWLCGVNFKMR